MCIRDSLTLLNPFAPHLTEEIHSRLQTAFPALAQTQLCQKSWPEWEEALLAETTVPMVIQMNGKLRDKLEAGSYTHLDAASLPPGNGSTASGC